MEYKITLPANPVMIQKETEKLSREDWLRIRNSVNGGYSIGGSDAAVIMGEGFSSPIDLYHRMAKIPMQERKMDQRILDEGHAYEREIAEKYCTKKGLHLVPYDNLMQSSQHDFMLGNIDFLAVDPRGGRVIGLEIKHTQPGNYQMQKDMRSGIPPAKYVWQVRHYMAVTGLSQFDLVLGWSAGDVSTEITNVEAVSIYRDEGIEQFLIEEEKAFVERSLLGIPPDMDGSDEEKALDALLRTYGKGDDSEVIFTTEEAIIEFREYAKAVEKAKDAKKAAEEAEKKMKAIAVKIRLRMEAASSAQVTDGDIKRIVCIKTRNVTSVNEEKLLAELPAVYESCKEFKSARFREKKGQIPNMNDYMISEKVPSEVPEYREVKVVV